VHILVLSLLAAAAVAWLATAIKAIQFVRAFWRWQELANKPFSARDPGSSMIILTEFIRGEPGEGRAEKARTRGRETGIRALCYGIACVVLGLIAMVVGCASGVLAC
jgi:hypothetical protein